MHAKAVVTTPTDEIIVNVTLSGTLKEFKNLRMALSDCLPYWQVGSIITAIYDVTGRVERQITGEPFSVPRPMVEGDL